jgi:hypothetical protein
MIKDCENDWYYVYNLEEEGYLGFTQHDEPLWVSLEHATNWSEDFKVLAYDAYTSLSKKEIADCVIVFKKEGTVNFLESFPMSSLLREYRYM